MEWRKVKVPYHTNAQMTGEQNIWPAKKKAWAFCFNWNSIGPPTSLVGYKIKTRRLWGHFLAQSVLSLTMARCQYGSSSLCDIMMRTFWKVEQAIKFQFPFHFLIVGRRQTGNTGEVNLACMLWDLEEMWDFTDTKHWAKHVICIIPAHDYETETVL